MSLLRDLSPSECLELLQTDQFGLPHHILFTLLDLAMRECLHFKVDNQSKSISIIKGRYKSSELVPHEKMMMGFIHRMRGAITLNQVLYQICYKTTDTGTYLGHYVRQSERLKPYLINGFWKRLFRKNKLSEYGIQMQTELHNELTTVQSGLSRTHKLDEEDLKYLFSIDANVFLVNDDLFKNAKNWKQSLAKNGVSIDVMKRFKHKFYIWENYISLRNIMLDKINYNIERVIKNKENESSSCSSCSSCAGCGGCS